MVECVPGRPPDADRRQFLGTVFQFLSRVFSFILPDVARHSIFSLATIWCAAALEPGASRHHGALEIPRIHRDNMAPSVRFGYEPNGAFDLKVILKPFL